MTPKKKKKQQLLAQLEGHRLFAHCLNGLSPIKPSTPDQKNATAQPSKPHACSETDFCLCKKTPCNQTVLAEICSSDGVK